MSLSATLGKTKNHLFAHHLEAHFAAVKYHVLRASRRLAIGPDLDGAIADYGRVVELEPNRPTSYYYRGLAYLTKQDAEAARRDLQRAADMGYEDAAKELTKLKR